jgi:hypothetical protein
VDVRRMEDLGLLTDDELLRMYLDWGYDEENARRMVIWTKQYVALPDLLARFRNGWITLDELKEELLKLGMKKEKVDEIIETKIKNTLKPERTQRERDLTKSEIIKGVKKGILDIETAKEMLMRLGYDEFEAEYIIVVNIEVESSPETPLEFRKLVENWRKAMGLEHKEIPKEVLEAERKYLELKKRLDEAIKRKERENIIAELNSKLADAEYRYFQLLRAYRLTETK